MSGPAPTVCAMSTATQLTFDDLGPALHQVTFVVVDLETDGGSPDGAGITEIGAVKVRGGEVLGEFQTLVNLGRPVPPFIRALTGITDEMLLGAPRLAAALPAFLEFAHGAVLVAHNAPYDVGFLKGACAQQGLTWPDPPVLDTARLARHVLSRDEVPNCKLGPSPGTSGPGHPQPPGPGRCPGHRRCAARPHGAGRQPRRAQPDRAAGLLQPGAGLASAQARPGRRPARRSGRLHLRGRPGGGPLRGHLALDPSTRAQLLHRRRAAPPDDRDGGPGPRWSPSRAPPRWRPRCASCAPSPRGPPATTAAPPGRRTPYGCG